jgi:hypothetical protein
LNETLHARNRAVLCAGMQTGPPRINEAAPL